MKYILLFLLSIIFNVMAVNGQNALHLDGVDDYVNLNAITPALQGQNAFTIEFWMQADLDSQSTVRSAIFAINKAPAIDFRDNQILLVLGGTGTTQDGKLIVVTQVDAPNNFPIVSNQVIGNDSCHHIAYVYNNGVSEAFIDGISIGTHTDPFTLGSSHRYSIGQEYDYLSPSNFYNGAIDDLRIWNTARTVSQIASNMSTVYTGSEPGLVGFYNFNQGISSGNNMSITTLNDLSGNTYHGNLSNFSLNGNRSNWIANECANNIPESVYDPKVLSEYFSIYPNPVKNTFYIKSQDLEIIKSVLLINHLGQNIISKEVKNFSYTLDMEHLPTGIYYVKITSSKGSYFSKLIKN